MPGETWTTKTSLFGGTLLAAGLAHADGVTLVTDPSGSYSPGAGFAEACATNSAGDITSLFGDDYTASGLTFEAVTVDGTGATDAHAYARTSSTSLRVEADLGPTGEYARAQAFQTFTVSSQLEASISWNALDSSYAGYVVWEFNGIGWDTLTDVDITGTTGSTTWTFFTGKTYLTAFASIVNTGDTTSHGEFDFAPASIPLPSTAGFTLAGLALIGVRRRR